MRLLWKTRRRFAVWQEDDDTLFVVTNIHPCGCYFYRVRHDPGVDNLSVFVQPFVTEALMNLEEPAWITTRTHSPIDIEQLGRIPWQPIRTFRHIQRNPLPWIMEMLL